MSKQKALETLSGTRLEQIRRRHVLRDIAIERVAEAGNGQYARWRDGKHVPSGDRLLRLCMHFRTSPPWLFGHEREDVRRYLVAVVTRELGLEAGQLLSMISRVEDPEERSRIVKALSAYSETEPEPPELTIQPWLGVDAFSEADGQDEVDDPPSQDASPQRRRPSRGGKRNHRESRR